MAVTVDGQVEVNGLLMGTGTRYHVVQFNPFTRPVRSRQADRAWNAGSWSGREFRDSTAVPLRLHIEADTDAGWVAAQQDLQAALDASDTDVNLTWQVDGVQYLMHVRPRLVDPDPGSMLLGHGSVDCALMALDPRIFSAAPHTASVGLPSSTGGLTVPVTVPITIGATVTDGRLSLTNAGRATTGLLLRIDAFGSPLVEPRVTVLTAGVSTTLRANFTLAAGQWLDIDTERRTAYLNGTSSRRGYMAGKWPLLAPGTSDLAFDAATYSSAAQLSVTWFDAW